MADDSNLKTTITTVAGQPASASGDNISVTQQSIPDLIAADKYLTGQTAAAQEGLGLRFRQVKNPSAV